MNFLLRSVNHRFITYSDSVVAPWPIPKTIDTRTILVQLLPPLSSSRSAVTCDASRSKRSNSASASVISSSLNLSFKHSIDRLDCFKSLWDRAVRLSLDWTFETNKLDRIRLWRNQNMSGGKKLEITSCNSHNSPRFDCGE